MNKNNKIETIDVALSRIMAPYSNYRISYQNIKDFNFKTPQIFGTILFDSNMVCNLHCIYCHNPRSNMLVKEEDFSQFVNTQVKTVDTFQIGCAMEPTMDKRIGNFIKMIHKSPARPKNAFRIQTNGTLLDRQDINLWKTFGVNTLSVSIDTIDPKVHKILRGGSNLKKILQNVSDVRKKWKKLEMWIVATVSKENIELLPDLVKYAANLGIDGIEIRRMYYYPKSQIIIDHDKMESMVLTNEQFLERIKILQNDWQDRIEFYISDEEQINIHMKNQIINPSPSII